MPHPLRASAADVGGVAVVVIREERGDSWVPRSMVRLTTDADGAITFVADYFHCAWLPDMVTP